MIIMLPMILGVLALLIVGLLNLTILRDGKQDTRDSGILMIVLSVLLFIVGVLVPMKPSYDTYVEMKQIYKATISQYRGSIEMYENKAVIEIDKSSFTDFKYEGYQKQMGSMIKDLRNQVSKYNKMYVGKREYADNPFFSWYIVEPSDDMKLIRLKTGGGMDKEG